MGADLARQIAQCRLLFIQRGSDERVIWLAGYVQYSDATVTVDDLLIRYGPTTASGMPKTAPITVSSESRIPTATIEMPTRTILGSSVYSQ